MVGGKASKNNLVQGQQPFLLLKKLLKWVSKKQASEENQGSTVTLTPLCKYDTLNLI